MNEQLQMHAPVSGGKEKLDSVRLIPQGTQVGRLFGIVHVGSQLNVKFGNYTEKVRFFFEFNAFKQVFYEDGELQPTVLNVEMTLSFSKKSKLRPFVSGMTGVQLSDEAAERFNIFDLIDKFYLVNISHSSPNQKGDVYANIISALPFDNRFVNQGEDHTPVNDVMAYYIPVHGFNSERFASLYYYLREMIKKSEQGLKHIQNGGTFAEPAQDGQNNSSSKGSGHVAPPPNQQPPQGGNQGWGQPQGNQNPAPPSNQPPQGNQPPQSGNQGWGQPNQGNQGFDKPSNQPPQNGNQGWGQPNQGTGVPPQGAQTTTAPAPQTQTVNQGQKVLRMVNTSHPYASWKQQGWTDDKLVAAGHAVWEQGPPSGKPNVQVSVPQSLNGLKIKEGDDDLPF